MNAKLHAFAVSERYYPSVISLSSKGVEEEAMQKHDRALILRWHCCDFGLLKMHECALMFGDL